MLPSKHSTLIQRRYMLKLRRNVGQRDIHVGSTSICQCWFIDESHRWNKVDFRLTVKTILSLYHDAWKIKIFILPLKRLQYFNVETTLSTLNQRRNLTLKQCWFSADSKSSFILMLWQSRRNYNYYLTLKR